MSAAVDAEADEEDGVSGGAGRAGVACARGGPRRGARALAIGTGGGGPVRR